MAASDNARATGTEGGDEGAMADFLRQVRCAWVIAKKNARVYYLKGPVVTFGIVFPLFFNLSFAAGHDAPTDVLALAGISTAFAVAAHFFHRRTRSRLA